MAYLYNLNLLHLDFKSGISLKRGSYGEKLF